MSQHNGRLFLPAWTENSAGPCGTFLIYSKFITWEDTALTKCQSYAVTGLLTGYIGARGHAQKLPPSAGSRELHTCDCTAGPTLLCHETGNEAFPKQIRQHTGNLAHRTFSWKSYFFPVSRAIYFHNKQSRNYEEYGEVRCRQAVSKSMLCSGKADVHIQQSPAPYTGTRAAWSIVSVKAKQECNTFFKI